MNGAQQTVDLVAESAQEFWQAVGSFLPGLVAAILLIILGALVAKLGEMITVRLLELVGVNRLKNRPQVAKTLQETGLNIDIVNVSGRVVFWVVIVIFAMTAVDVMGLTAMSDVLRALIGYLPNVIAAVVILTVTIAGGRLAKGIIAAGLRQLSIDYAGLIAAVAQWAIVIFGTVLTLDQLGVNTTILTTNLTVIMAGLMLAFGLAFGLGGREHAARALDALTRESRPKK